MEQVQDWQATVTDLVSSFADGDTDIVVEALQSIPAFTEDSSEILTAGIPVHRTEEFDELRTMLAHGATDA